MFCDKNADPIRPVPKKSIETVAVRSRFVPWKHSRNDALPSFTCSSSRVSFNNSRRISRLSLLPYSRERDLRASSGRFLERSQTGDLKSLGNSRAVLWEAMEKIGTYSGMKTARSGKAPTTHCMANTVFQADGLMIGTKARTMPREVACIRTEKKTSPCNTGPLRRVGATFDMLVKQYIGI